MPRLARQARPRRRARARVAHAEPEPSSHGTLPPSLGAPTPRPTTVLSRRIKPGDLERLAMRRTAFREAPISGAAAAQLTAAVQPTPATAEAMSDAGGGGQKRALAAAPAASAQKKGTLLSHFARSTGGGEEATTQLRSPARPETARVGEGAPGPLSPAKLLREASEDQIARLVGRGGRGR